MSKVIRKWIETDWSKEGVVRAVDIPYSQEDSIKTRIDKIKSVIDNSIKIDELNITPSPEAGLGKLFVEGNDLFFLDEDGNKIKLTNNGTIASVDRTKIENHTQYYVLSGTDITNQYVMLAKEPYPLTSTEMVRMGGGGFEYAIDYKVVPYQGENLKLVWDSTNCSVGLVTVLQAGDVLRVNYIAPEQLQDYAVVKRVDYNTVSASDATTCYLTLSYIVDEPTALEFQILQGGSAGYMRYGTDFIVKQDSNNDYKIVSWAASETTGGLSSVIISGDVIKLTYTSTDPTQIQPIKKHSSFYDITATELANKYVILPNTPVPLDATELNVLGGMEYRYGVDFIVKRDTSNQFRKLSWAAADLTDGTSVLESILISGDTIQTVYMDGVGLIGSIRVSENDIAPDFLIDKLEAGAGILLSVVNDGTTEKVRISADITALIDKEVEQITLTGGMITAGYADLSATPINGNEVELTVIGGPDQQYGRDFSIVQNGSSIYKRLTWDSAYSGTPGTPPTVGITVLVAGEVLKLSYIRQP
jgi:hypothetical protein